MKCWPRKSVQALGVMDLIYSIYVLIIVLNLTRMLSNEYFIFLSFCCCCCCFYCMKLEPTIPASVIHLPLSFFPSSVFSGKLLEMKSTWSSGPISHTQASLSHELWKVSPGTRNSSAPSRPPPGLTNTKPSSTWGGNSLGLSQGWTSSYSSGKSPVHHCDINSKISYSKDASVVWPNSHPPLSVWMLCV